MSNHGVDLSTSLASAFAADDARLDNIVERPQPSPPGPVTSAVADSDADSKQPPAEPAARSVDGVGASAERVTNNATPDAVDSSAGGADVLPGAHANHSAECGNGEDCGSVPHHAEANDGPSGVGGSDSGGGDAREGAVGGAMGSEAPEVVAGDAT